VFDEAQTLPNSLTGIRVVLMEFNKGNRTSEQSGPSPANSPRKYSAAIFLNREEKSISGQGRDLARK
jgi:hypothetical protein